MEPVPLIPTPNFIRCPEVSHVVQDVFQDVISEKNFTEYDLNRIQKRCVNKKYVTDVLETFCTYESSTGNVKNVERTIMCNQGKYIKREDKILNNEKALEMIKLKRHPVFHDLDLSVINEYALIAPDQIHPSKLERSFDPSLNDEYRRHLKNHLDKSDTSLEMCSYKHKADKGDTIKTKERCLKSLIKPRPFRSQVCDLKEAKSDKKYFEKLPTVHNDIIFKAEPPAVFFYGYKRNQIYKQIVRLYNISNRVGHFCLGATSLNSRFRVTWNCKSTSVVPGLYVSFTVEFSNDVFDDMCEHFVVRVKDGKNVKIKFESFRNDPILTGIIYHGSQMFEHYSYLSDMSLNRFKVLNSTVEFAECLLGSFIKINLILQNIGGNSSFFIMSELDWYFSEINDLTKDMELINAPFKIYPAYFKMKTNEIIEIETMFAPNEYGTQISKFFIICDNCALNYLDFVGDGIYFDESFVTIMAQFKNFLLNIDTDQESDFIMNMGTVLAHTDKTLSLFVTNHSPVDLAYEWRLRKPDFTFFPNTQMLLMRPEWITMKKFKGILPLESEECHYIRINLDTDIPGSYRYVVAFYINNIPEESLKDNCNFTVEESENYEETHLLDILVAEIEIWVDCITSEITLNPYVIDIRGDFFEIHGNPIERNVSVYNPTEISAKCQWRIPNKEFKTVKINIDPMEFTVLAKEEQACKILLSTYEYTNCINTKISCLIENTNFVANLHLKVEIRIPKITVSTHFLNFGIVKKGTFHCKPFSIINETEMQVEIVIDEYLFDDVYKCLTLTNKVHLTSHRGFLYHRGNIWRPIYALNTQTFGRWLSVLVINTKLSQVTRAAEFILVYGVIAMPQVTISCNNAEDRVLTVNYPLYIGIPSVHTISLLNHTPIPANFIWGIPKGADAPSVSITVSPNEAAVPSGDIKDLEVTIIPNTYGIFDKIFVPCFIGRTEIPLFLNIHCEVHDISVLFKMPDDASITWPSPSAICFPDSTETIEICKTASEQLHEVNVPPNSLSDIARNLKNESDLMLGTHQTKTDEISDEAVNCNCDPCYILNNNDGTVENNLPLNKTSISSSSYNTDTSLCNFSFSSSQVVSLKSRDSVNVYNYKLDRKVFPETDAIIAFEDVPLRKVVKKSFAIVNQTPIPTNCNLTVENFYKSFYPPDLSLVQKMQNQLSVHQIDKWSQIKYLDDGIVIVIEPMQGALEGYGILTFEVSVFADTWGIYFDKIVCCIGNLHPFTIKLVAEVTGHPITLPMFIGNCRSEPILRFSIHNYVSKANIRTIKIQNTACIPITIDWFLFENSDEQLPFNAVLNLSKNTDEGIPFDINLIPFMGQTKQSYFQIEPRILSMDCYSTTTVNLIFNPSYVDSDLSCSELKTILVGFVKISEENSSSSCRYKRYFDTLLRPVKVNLLAEVDTPLFSLKDSDSNSTKIIAYASAIVENGCQHFEKSLLFTNTSRAPATVSLMTTNPLALKSVHCFTTNKELELDGFTVEGGGIIKVLWECILIREHVQELSQHFSADSKDSKYLIVDNQYKCITMKNNLIIKQDALVKQILPIQIKIYYPDMRVVPEIVDFGTVYIGNKKRYQLTLENKTQHEINYSTMLLNESIEFEIVPSEGVIPAGTATTPQAAYLIVIFQPRERKKYEDILKIITDFECFFCEVKLTGAGSYDSKYYGLYNKAFWTSGN